ncbi:NH(3)-dependent NAD(+) synthetase [Peptococcaceae bacterium CEB3]|nr:NH(3)-dependent NAD(+) synthetase [Peptococcaceae bacterium CEB3]
MWTDEEIQSRIRRAVEWLREQALQARAQGLLVGISGGVDSAVVAGLCKRAFPEHSLAVIMPAQSNPRDREDALLVAKTHDLCTLEVELANAHRLIMTQVEESLTRAGLEARGLRTSQGNLKARLRMSTLYAVANALNYLVVGTDNAPESYTGYFTKYGDGGVDVLPISSLTKSEVRVWAKALGLPDEISERTPSAGLWAGQTDEKEMGLTYDELDRYLLGGEVKADVRERIEALHRASEHKRHLPPSLELPRPESLV